MAVNSKNSFYPPTVKLQIENKFVNFHTNFLCFDSLNKQCSRAAIKKGPKQVSDGLLCQSCLKAIRQQGKTENIFSYLTLLEYHLSVKTVIIKIGRFFPILWRTDLITDAVTMSEVLKDGWNLQRLLYNMYGVRNLEMSIRFSLKSRPF